MWSATVVILPPVLRLALHFLQIIQQFPIQPLRSQTCMEAFHMPVLSRRSRVNILGLHSRLLHPLAHLFGNELRSIVAAQMLCLNANARVRLQECRWLCENPGKSGGVFDSKA